jgi:photosystem II stability/assembly factor-like uncharacterized protein
LNDCKLILEAVVKKLLLASLLLLLMAGLAACGIVSTPPSPTPIPTITKTAIPPAPTAAPTPAPIPPLNSPNGPPLKSIHMFTTADGWGVLANSLLVTHNGGVNWFSVPLPEGQLDDQSETFFVDVNTAYLVIPAPDRQSGLLYYTNNGGGSWKSSRVPFLRGQLTFMDSVGYFVQTTATAADSMKVTVFSSNDNGLNWDTSYPGQQQSASSSIPEAGIKTGGAFINPDRGWIGLAAQRGKITLYRTDNSAKDWILQDLPAPKNIAGLETTTLSPVLFKGNDQDALLPVDFVALDTGDRNRVFFSTADGGDTWSPGGSVIDAETYTFVNPKTGWVWGKRGLYFTNDGAQTWQFLPVAFGKSEHAIALNFVDPSTGWLVTADAKNRVRIYNTHDGGNTWMAVNP